ncbi:hypothetical protein EDEG_00152 [Edhazardia aedis USNM 41457]|uniref:Uncharacterized protein n=1 Tax=Edhazardia aedis (strain USNM 41457) TaxID=1003232 RepID=J9D8Z5_EDHAE|nr:hypothetical protein EDEG_00152 [Edhazardia aedis USNM 41457]|eukprot:EJW04236.1 hypothetical protein EDEG_00152 [Edhazardia aedis USNM 41457]
MNLISMWVFFCFIIIFKLPGSSSFTQRNSIFSKINNEKAFLESSQSNITGTLNNNEQNLSEELDLNLKSSFINSIDQDNNSAFFNFTNSHKNQNNQTNINVDEFFTSIKNKIFTQKNNKNLVHKNVSVEKEILDNSGNSEIRTLPRIAENNTVFTKHNQDENISEESHLSFIFNQLKLLMVMLTDLLLLEKKDNQLKRPCVFFEPEDEKNDTKEHLVISKNVHNILSLYMNQNRNQSDIFYRDFFQNDNRRSEIINKIINNQSIQELLIGSNSSFIYPNHILHFDNRAFLSEFKRFKEKTRDFQFLPILIEKSNFQGYKNKKNIKDEEEEEKDILFNQTNDNISEPCTQIHLNNTNNRVFYQNNNISYVDFWSDLKKQMKNFKELTLDCFLSECSEANAHLIQLISDYNFALCLNANQLVLDFENLQKARAIEKCYLKSVNCAIINILAKKELRLCRTSLRFIENDNIVRVKVGNTVRVRGYHAGLAERIDESQNKFNNSINIQENKIDFNAKKILSELIDVCANFKFINFDTRDVLTKFEAQKIEELLGSRVLMIVYVI